LGIGTHGDEGVNCDYWACVTGLLEETLGTADSRYNSSWISGTAVHEFVAYRDGMES